MQRRREFVRWWKAVRWLLAVILFPFAALGLLSLAMRIYGLVRTNPAFFGVAYVQRYEDVSLSARSLEQALQTCDTQALAELQGLRWPIRLPCSSDIALVMLWDRNSRYSTYLYFDRLKYQKYLYCFERARGRWVVLPPDLYYAMRSGGWRRAFLPAASAWWLLGAAGLGGLRLCRRSARVRAWLLGG